jgi:hypothetical protein
MGFTAAQGVEESFDWQRLRHQVLEPLRAGRPARYRPYSWLPGGGLDELWVTVDATPIIVLEGVYTARPRLSGRYGVMAMETGARPTLIAVPALLVTVEIGVTVFEPLLTT